MPQFEAGSCKAYFEDSNFVPLTFVTLGFGSQIPFIKGHVPWFKDPNLKGTKDKSLITSGPVSWESAITLTGPLTCVFQGGF